MGKIIKINKGLDIKLHGKAEQVISTYEPNLYAVQPSDFRVLLPRLLVQEGDYVKIGSPVIQDKNNENLLLTSPVSGFVKTIVRGEKRRLEQIVIESDKKHESIDFGAIEDKNLDRQMIVDKLLLSGLWPLIRQRPYGVIANPQDVPDAIFISGFDTAPLAPDTNFVMKHHSAEMFQKGINVLKKLTSGLIHLNVNPDFSIPELFLHISGVQINQFTGPHPSGNIGVQIHHICPLTKDDVVWYLYPQDVVNIAYLFVEGKLNLKRIIANTGSELIKPSYIETIAGACVADLIKNNLKQENARIISGNVLTGKNIGKYGFLRMYDTMLTAIPEGDYYEFLGWAMPGFKKFSVSRTFFSWLCPKKHYSLDTNKHGEERAFVMTGEYEKVFPMHIMPVQLLKAIITRDIDKMERLGIYEVVEEDFALCEFICTSKINSQHIVKEGIDFMLKELS